MITVNGKVYDGVAMKPSLDEALEHYGIKGMKWRQHLKRGINSLKNGFSNLRKRLSKYRIRTVSSVINASTGERRNNAPFKITPKKRKSWITTTATVTDSSGKKRKVNPDDYKPLVDAAKKFKKKDKVQEAIDRSKEANKRADKALAEYRKKYKK